jgi:hypothetical protein
MYFTEATFAQEHEEEVALIEDWVVVEAGLVFVVDPLELTYVQVSFPLQLFHFQLEVRVLFLECTLSQLQNK